MAARGREDRRQRMASGTERGLMFIADKLLTMLILPTALMTECGGPPGTSRGRVLCAVRTDPGLRAG